MALDTNWRENGGIFVCARSGNDASGDGSKAKPYKTIRDLGNTGGVTSIIRAGYYEAGEFNFGANVGLTPKIIGDGKVIINSSNYLYFNNWTQRYAIENIELIDGDLLNATTTNFAKNCIFRNLTHQRPVVERSIYISCNISFCSTFLVTIIDSTVNNSNLLRKTIFDNCTISLSGTFDNCAFVDNSTLGGNNIKDITLDGETSTIGNTYASNIRFSGTATVGGESVTFTNCFYTDDPMFNDAANGDYTLQSNLSPLFNNGNIIGCYGVADKFDLSHPAFQTANGATYTNISGLDANGDPVGGGTPLGIASGTDAKFSTSNDPNQCFTLSDTITITDPVQWFGQFIYDSSGNGKWIDTANYVELTNPEVRLTYGIQFYDENEPNPDTLDNWSKTYQMEVNMPIERDGSASGGLGNGNVDADLQNLGSITFKRFRLVDVTLRNNGV